MKHPRNSRGIDWEVEKEEINNKPITNQEEINNKPCSYFGQEKYMHEATKVKFDLKKPLPLTRSLMIIIKLESRQANEHLSYGNILLFYKMHYCICMSPRVIFCKMGDYLNLVREKIK